MVDPSGDDGMADEARALLVQFAQSLTHRTEPWAHAHLLVGVFHQDENAWLVVPRACLEGVGDLAVTTYIPPDDQVDAVTAAEKFMPESSTAGDAYLMWARLSRDEDATAQSEQVPDATQFGFTRIDGLLPRHLNDDQAILDLLHGRSPVRR